ncbi:hypothetical protein C8J57DRAFT_1505431 [Mycena rebaudengoi]|nr:hypothetical protein C8J57DRAFT_1505431 [Mycena rebaudengoi]
MDRLTYHTCAAAAQERASRTAARRPRSAHTDTPRRAPPRTAAPGKDIKCSSGILCVSAAQKYQHTRAQKGITRKSATHASRASSLRTCLSKCARTPTPSSRAPRPRAPAALRPPRTRALRMTRLRTPCHLHRMQHALPPRQRLPIPHAPRARTAHPPTHIPRIHPIHLRRASLTSTAAAHAYCSRFSLQKLCSNPQRRCARTHPMRLPGTHDPRHVNTLVARSRRSTSLAPAARASAPPAPPASASASASPQAPPRAGSASSSSPARSCSPDRAPCLPHICLRLRIRPTPRQLLRLLPRQLVVHQRHACSVYPGGQRIYRTRPAGTFDNPSH